MIETFADWNAKYDKHKKCDQLMVKSLLLRIMGADDIVRTKPTENIKEFICGM